MNRIYQSAKRIYEANAEEVKSAIARIFKMFFIAQKEGIFQLEVFILEEEDFQEKHFLTKAIEYISDGIESEKMSALLRNRVLAQSNEKQQFICLLYKDGAEFIQKGEHIHYVKEYIASLFPESMEDEILRFMNLLIKEENAKQQLEKEIRVPNEFKKVHIELPMDLQEKMKLFERKMLQNTDAICIRDWLREMEHFDVSSLLLAGNDNLRELFLSNMSKRLRLMIMEDVILREQELGTSYVEEIKNIEQAVLRGISVLDSILEKQI